MDVPGLLLGFRNWLSEPLLTPRRGEYHTRSLDASQVPCQGECIFKVFCVFQLTANKALQVGRHTMPAAPEAICGVGTKRNERPDPIGLEAPRE